MRLACPNDCSGHGQCRRLLDIEDKYNAWDYDKTAKCVCENGYQGLDCSQRKCPMGDDPITRTGVNEIQSFGLTQADHKLMLEKYMTSTPAGHAMFALEFTDEMGDKWVTHPIDWTNGNHAYFYDKEAGMMRQPAVVAQGVSASGNSDTTAFIAAAAPPFSEMADTERPDGAFTA